MKIIIQPEVMYRLMAYAAITRDEFSGFGFCEREDGDIVIYDFVLLDVGSETYTEIEPARVLPLLQREDRKNMKVWLHRHPLGSGIPGPHNWSGRDERTIRHEPLGATPEAVNWSVSVVLTPGGFVGRIDNYLNGKTQHLEVEPNTRNLIQEVRDLVRQDPFHISRLKRKSKGSLPDEIPALESANQAINGPNPKKTRIIGRARPKKNTGSPEEMTTQTFMSVYGNYAGGMIQIATPLPKSAKNGVSTGSTNENEIDEGSSPSGGEA